jgi:DeoR/GlpR family transcriptional regulator of sugar metabolism
VTQLPKDRQQQILLWLHEQTTLTIDDLAARLNVSAMTIHRDLNELAQSGYVEKVHGGVTLAERVSPASEAAHVCSLCGVQVSARTTFLIQREHEPFYACCPHCGFLMLDDLGQSSTVLVREFIYGRMVNALQATYLIESDIHLCCVPSILAFTSLADAERVQLGFNGWSATFDEARRYMRSQHDIHSQ